MNIPNYKNNDMLSALKLTLPIALSVFSYGLVYGVLARQYHFSLLNTVTMSSLVYAGATQLIVVKMWHSPLPILQILIATFSINIRYAIMGATLKPFFKKTSFLKTIFLIHFFSDENWALSMTESCKGRNSIIFFVSSGLLIYLSWNISSIIGYFLGEFMGRPEHFGLDFAFIAIFIVLAVELWFNDKMVYSWIIAAIVAIIVSYLLPGKWYILVGGLVGAIFGMVENKQ